MYIATLLEPIISHMTNTCLQVVHLKKKPNKLASMFFTLQKALVPLVECEIIMRQHIICCLMSQHYFGT